MPFDAVAIDQAYRVAVSKPADELVGLPIPGSAAWNRSPIAIQGRLRAYLREAKTRDRDFRLQQKMTVQEERSIENQLKTIGLTLDHSDDLTQLNNRIDHYDIILEWILKAIDSQERRVEVATVSRGPIGKSILQIEKRLLSDIKGQYDNSVAHFYFLLSVRANSERDDDYLVLSTPEDIDRLLA